MREYGLHPLPLSFGCSQGVSLRRRHGMVGGRRAVQPDGRVADAEPALGVVDHRHPGLGRRRILRRVGLPATAVFRFRYSQPKSKGTGKSARRPASAGPRPGTAGPPLRRLRRDRERPRHLRVLLLVEDHDLLPGPADTRAGRPGRRTRERSLVDLRVAPDHEVRAAGEGAAVEVAGREVGGQRLAVVGRVPAPRSGRRRCTRPATEVSGSVADGLDVDQGLALGEVLARVDVEVVAPEDVLVGGVARAAGPK